MSNLPLIAGLAVAFCAPIGPALAQPAAPSKPGQPAPSPGERAPKDQGSLVPKLDATQFFEGEAQLVAGDLAFVEGPVWCKPVFKGDKGFFAFCSLKDTTTDGPGTIYRLRDEGGATSDAKPSVWIAPSGGAIGLAVDSRGRIYAAEKDTRAITRRVPDGEGSAWKKTMVAEKFQDKRLNDTNDLIMTDDGSIYFTDPTFFTKKDALELEHKGVYRVSPEGTISLVAKMKLPNGLALSNDGKTLYVAEFGEQRIMAIELKDGATTGTYGEPIELINLKTTAAICGIPTRGGCDGLRVDSQGNIYATGPGGIWVVSADGRPLAHLATPATNLAFGGPDGKTMLITAAGGKVMRVRTKIPGWIEAKKE